jgi:hypothetical protein
MSEIPGARVVRGVSGGERRAGAEAAPEGTVLGLAPRALPRGLFWRLIFGQAAVFGWLFASFGMLAVLVFLPSADLSFATYDRQASATTTGIEETGSKELKRKIYGVSYTFRDEAGIEHRGESYTTDPPASPGTWEGLGIVFERRARGATGHRELPAAAVADPVRGPRGGDGHPDGLTTSTMPGPSSMHARDSGTVNARAAPPLGGGRCDVRESTPDWRRADRVRATGQLTVEGCVTPPSDEIEPPLARSGRHRASVAGVFA